MANLRFSLLLLLLAPLAVLVLRWKAGKATRCAGSGRARHLP